MSYCLIDGNAILHAAQYSTPLSVDGRPTHATFGFLRTLNVTYKKFPSYDNFMILWDTKAQWRFDIYPGYKDKRDVTDDQVKARSEIKSQTPDLSIGLQHLGIPQVVASNFEADDLAGYFCRKAMNEGEQVKLITGDEDWMQLVNSRTSWLDTRSGATKRCNRMNFEEMTGCKNGKEFLQSKVLQGDGSDKITGVGGIGPKTAGPLIKHFGGIAGVLKLYDEQGEIKKGDLPKEIQRALKKINALCQPEGRKIIARNLKLMNLQSNKRDDEIESAMRIKRGDFNFDAFLDWCMKNQFQSIINNRDVWLQTFGESEDE
jgi:DNA polymerase-1